MPPPVSEKQRYVPGLDGIRAIAVAAVIGYHLGPALGYEKGLPGFAGGLLGVGVFFTLSGYLITSLLVWEFMRNGRLRLRAFWVRRFRRLLPAAVLLLLVVLCATALLERNHFSERLQEVIAGLFYYANWHTIAGGGNYFAMFADTSPLEHIWSLSVEEQFYILWPLVLVAIASTRLGSRKRAALTTLGLAGASFVLLAVLGRAGTTVEETFFNATRAYEGTDTRAGGLLLGAAAAIWWSGERRNSGRPRWQSDAVGLAGLVGIFALFAWTDRFDRGLYTWGLLALSIATTVLVVAVTRKGSMLDRVLGIAPLRWIGERSYGIYLWHLPIIVFCANHLPTNAWIRGGLLVAMIVVLADLSWRFVEDPIRRHGLRAALGPKSPATAPPTGLLGWRPRTGLAAMGLVAMAGIALPAALTLLPKNVPVRGGDTAAAAAPNAAPAPTKLGPPRSTCHTVIHVGESTSEGLISPNYLPNPADRIVARYHSVGVHMVYTDIAGARSIVERYKGQANAEEAVQATTQSVSSTGRCWVIALGVNDTANHDVNSGVSLSERINRILKHIPSAEPVVWVNVRTLVSYGSYSMSLMNAWNAALRSACPRPNFHIYDWASEAEVDWFISDGIHYTTPGYRQRARRIARALARATPKTDPQPRRCVVSSL